VRLLALLLLGCSGAVEHDPACSDWEARDVPTDYGTCLLLTPGDEQLRFRLSGEQGCGSTCLVIAPGETYTALLEPGGDPSTLGSLKPVDCSATCP
jgi:hypothetical protein